jgi:hypothetical protein
VEVRGFFTKALHTARLVDDPAMATMLLGPFWPEMLTTSHAKALSALLESYGEPWAGNLVAACPHGAASTTPRACICRSGSPRCRPCASLSRGPEMPGDGGSAPAAGLLEVVEHGHRAGSRPTGVKPAEGVDPAQYSWTAPQSHPGTGKGTQRRHY